MKAGGIEKERRMSRRVVHFDELAWLEKARMEARANGLLFRGTVRGSWRERLYVRTDGLWYAQGKQVGEVVRQFLDGRVACRPAPRPEALKEARRAKGGKEVKDK